MFELAATFRQVHSRFSLRCLRFKLTSTIAGEQLKTLLQEHTTIKSLV